MKMATQQGVLSMINVIHNLNNMKKIIIIKENNEPAKSMAPKYQKAQSGLHSWCLSNLERN